MRTASSSGRRPARSNTPALSGWLSACLCVLAATPCPGAADQSPTLSVRAGKARYVAGEPIDIVLTISNPGPQPAEFWFQFPNTFNPEMCPLQFDGNRVMPRLPSRVVGFSGPFYSLTTEIGPGQDWSAIVFLQTQLRQPPPGTHQVEYRFHAGYFLGPRPEGEAFGQLVMKRIDRDRDNDGPSLDAKGTLAITVGRKDPAALDRILAQYRTKLGAEKPGDDPQRVHWSINDAYDAVDDPIVIRHLAALLPPVDVPSSRLTPHNAEAIYRSLARFHDRDEAQRIMLAQLRSDKGVVDTLALDWLQEAGVPVPAETIVAMIDRELPEGHGADGELRYLLAAKTAATPALRDRVARCLDGDTNASPVLALELLARWEVPRDPTIERTLERVAGRLRQPDQNPWLDDVLNVLALWRYPAEAETLRPLLQRSQRSYRMDVSSVLGYLRTVRLEGHKTLEPEVASMLSRVDAEVLLSALETLGMWGYRLTAAQTAHLRDQGEEVREAARRYLEKTRPH